MEKSNEKKYTLMRSALLEAYCKTWPSNACSPRLINALTDAVFATLGGLNTITDANMKAMERAVNPPLCVVNIDYAARAEKANEELEKYKKIFGIFYIKKE